MSTAITQVICQDLNTRVLAAPWLRTEHCDRLLKLLLAHDAGAIDGYSEGLRAEYLTARVTIRDLVRHQRELAGRMGLKPGDSVAKGVFAPCWSTPLQALSHHCRMMRMLNSLARRPPN